VCDNVNLKLFTKLLLADISHAAALVKLYYMETYEYIYFLPEIYADLFLCMYANILTFFHTPCQYSRLSLKVERVILLAAMSNIKKTSNDSSLAKVMSQDSGRPLINNELMGMLMLS